MVVVVFVAMVVSCGDNNSMQWQEWMGASRTIVVLGDGKW